MVSKHIHKIDDIDIYINKLQEGNYILKGRKQNNTNEFIMNRKTTDLIYDSLLIKENKNI